MRIVSCYRCEHFEVDEIEVDFNQVEACYCSKGHFHEETSLPEEWFDSVECEDFEISTTIKPIIFDAKPISEQERELATKKLWNEIMGRIASGGMVMYIEQIERKIVDGEMIEEKTNLPVYLYGMRLRGFSIGCQPMEGFYKRIDVPVGRYHDVLIYDRQLTQKELDDYELDYLCTGNDKYYYEDGESIVCIEDGQVTELVGEAAEEQRRLLNAILG